jgi:hypothetical protein
MALDTRKKESRAHLGFTEERLRGGNVTCATETRCSSSAPHRVCWSLGATDSRAIWESPPSYIPGDKSSISIPIFTALLPAER